MQLLNLRVGSIETTRDKRGSEAELERLKKSILEIGLLHPLVLNSNHELIAGRRRLEAVRELQWTHVPAVVVETLDDLNKALLAERDENTCRLDLTPTQKKAIADRIRQLEKPGAEIREKAGKSANSDPGQSTTQGRAKRVDDMAAEAAETSRPTLRKIDEIVDSGEQDIIEEMDATGKVDPAHKKLKERQAEAESTDPLADAAAAFCAKLNGYTRQIDAWQREFADLKREPLAHHVHWETVLSQLTAVRKAIHQGRPKRRCPYCKATGKKGRADCGTCKATAFVCESIYRAGVEAHGVPPGETGGKDDE